MGFELVEVGPGFEHPAGQLSRGRRPGARFHVDHRPPRDNIVRLAQGRERRLGNSG